MEDRLVVARSYKYRDIPRCGCSPDEYIVAGRLRLKLVLYRTSPAGVFVLFFFFFYCIQADLMLLRPCGVPVVNSRSSRDKTNRYVMSVWLDAHSV